MGVVTRAFDSFVDAVPVFWLTGNPLSRTYLRRSVLIACFPVGSNVAALIFYRPLAVGGLAWLWILYYCAFEFWLLFTARRLFRTGKWATTYLDALLLDSSDIDVARFLLSRRTSLTQVAVCSTVATALIVAVGLVQPSLQGALEIGPASYIAVGLVAFTAMNGGYWAFVWLRLLNLLAGTDRLAVRHEDPLRTPALQALLATSQQIQFMTLITFLAGEAPMVLDLILWRGSAAVIVVNVVVPLVSLLFVLASILLPHHYLTRVIRREKSETLRLIISGKALDSTFSGDPGARPLLEETSKMSYAERVHIYSLVSSFPETTYSRAGVGQIILAVTTLGIPPIAQLVHQLISG